MKTYLLALTMLIAPFIVSAQSQTVKNFFDTYADEESYTLVDIKGSLLNMLSDKEKRENKRTKITGFQILSAPKGKGSLNENAVKGFAGKIKRESFEDLMVVRDGKTRVNFMIQEDNGIINELIMVCDEDDSFTVMSLRGHIPVEEIEDLGDDIDIDGLDHLKKNKN